MDETSKRSLELHEQLHGKIEVVARAKAATADDLAVLYPPGVAEPCRVKGGFCRHVFQSRRDLPEPALQMLCHRLACLAPERGR